MSSNDKIRSYPFSARCPSCGKDIDGLVDPSYCLGGGGPFSDKVSGLVAVRCGSCGKTAGLRLRIVENKIVVISCDIYAKLLAEDFEAIRRKSRGQ